MDFDVINNLGYFEITEISVWLGIMYFGKCWIDNFFKDRKESLQMPKLDILRMDLGSKKLLLINHLVVLL